MSDSISLIPICQDCGEQMQVRDISKAETLHAGDEERYARIDLECSCASFVYHQMPLSRITDITVERSAVLKAKQEAKKARMSR